MFNPSAADVRRFFCRTYSKYLNKTVLSPLETIAAHWLVVHPEYHTDLSHEELAIKKDYLPESGQVNPFLHLSMHVSISEQVQADIPLGLKSAYQLALLNIGDVHQTHHAIMEILGSILWESQRLNLPPDMSNLVESVRRLK